MRISKTSPEKWRDQRGQTILLVAISLISLLAMAALAIDVVTLYVARSEIERAADATALAGAKAFVDSGLTSSTTPSPALQGLATNMATAYINAALPVNTVGGVAPVLASGSPQIITATASGYGNPYVTLTLTQTALPTFFARIWGTRFASVSATASAEAYNPSNFQASTGVSVAPMCVKPILVANADPDQSGAAFVDPISGTVESGVLGELIKLRAKCNGPCAKPFTAAQGQYLPAQVAFSAANSFCPSTTASPKCDSSALPYQQSVQCCDGTVYACGGPSPNAAVDIATTAIRLSTQRGLQCAIHASGNGLLKGQDAIDVSNFTSSSGPVQITPATEPLGAAAGSFVNTSDSIMTFPIFVPNSNTNLPNVTIIGFLQVFVNQSGAAAVPPQDFDGYIVNVVGCSGTAAVGTPISGGGTSPVPVRLITPGS